MLRSVGCARSRPEGKKGAAPNWQEYVAGTNPTNANSVFKITSEQIISGTNIVLHWSSVSNRLYDILRSTNLTSGASAPVPNATNLFGTPPENSWTGIVSDFAPGFYSIRVHQ